MSDKESIDLTADTEKDFSGVTDEQSFKDDNEPNSVVSDFDEKSEFEQELENYLPTPENTDKLKKPVPVWVVAVAASAATTLVLITLYSIIILPHLKPAAVISYVKNTAQSAAAENNINISAVNENLADSIATISTKSKYTNFFGMSPSSSIGSGIIVSSDGYILTSNSIVDRDGETTVILSDKNKYSATFVGADDKKDIALLKINASNLTAATLGNSDSVHAGDTSIVIGNMLGSELGASITRGIICGINKNAALQSGGSINLLQTDAVSTSNNAGGCLLNANGEVIGMITYAVSSNVNNISFAIPSNDIKSVIESLINTGKPTETLIIGISGTGSDHGIAVESIVKDSPAQKAGLKEGDLILKIDDSPVKTIDDLNRIRDSHKKGDVLKFTIYRDGNTSDISVKL